MIDEVVHVAQAIVRAGVGSFSFLEMAWLVIGLICLKDTGCAFIDARAQLQVAALPPVDDVQRLLALIDHRLALEAVLVQVAFVLIGLVAAYRPAPPTTAEDHPLLDVAVVMLLMGVQVLHLAGARHRHGALARIDRRLRSRTVVGGRRHDDPKEGSPL